MTVAPDMLLPPSAMPWGRSVEDRLSGAERFAFGLEPSESAASGSAGAAAVDGMSEQLSVLSRLTRIDQYTIPPFSVTYSGNPIGDPPGIVELPTWHLNIPPSAELVTVIISLDTADTNDAATPLAGRKMAYKLGWQVFLSMEAVLQNGNPALSSSQVVRSAMATVPATHPLPVTIAFQHSAITGGTLSGGGSITAIAYGR